MQGTQSLIIAPILYSKKSFEQRNAFLHTFNGAIAGILLMAIFFSFLLFIRIRNKIFLYYAFFVAALFFMLGSFYAFNFQLLWSNTPLFNEIMTSASISLYSFFGLIFTRKFLRTNINMPTMNKLAGYFTYTLFMLFLSNFIIEDKMLITNISVILVSINSILILWIAILAYIRKLPASKSFLYA